MLVGALSPVSNKADWIVAYALDDAETGDPVDISDASEITIAIRNPANHYVELSATLSGGGVQHIETGVFEWTFTATQMRNLCAKNYEVGLTILKDGETTQLIIGTLGVLDGVVT